MKTWILALAMMMGITVSAQEKREQLKPEQRAELHVKKLTLDLDLTKEQQDDLKKFLTDKNKENERYRSGREEGKKMSADERFALRNKMLDDKIAMKSKMRQLLRPEQFSKWESMKTERKHKITKRNKKLKKHQRR